MEVVMLESWSATDPPGAPSRYDGQSVRARASSSFLGALLALFCGCGDPAQQEGAGPPPAAAPQAGLLRVPPRDVAVHGADRCSASSASSPRSTGRWVGAVTATPREGANG